MNATEARSAVSSMRIVGRLRDICYLTTIFGLIAAIPVATETVLTPYEWIYWLLAAVIVAARTGTVFLPPNHD